MSIVELLEQDASEVQTIAGEDRGFSCRKCGCRDLRVYRTERLREGRVRRIRYCRNCGTRKTTVEKELGA